MGRVEDAVIYAAKKHNGQVRKIGKIPYIIHPLEVASIIATMTGDEDIIIAGILHDIVEDTDTSADEVRELFGDRVCSIVSSETENKYRDQKAEDTWKKRKEESLKLLSETDDEGVRILWLADKLANLRSMYRNYRDMGDAVWDHFHQKDPMMHKWYFTEVARLVEPDLKDKAAYMEYCWILDRFWGGSK